MTMDVSGIIFLIAAGFSTVFAAMSVFSMRDRACALFAALSTAGLAAVSAVLGSGFVSAIFLTAAAGLLALSKSFSREECRSKEITFGFMAVVGSIVAACVVIVLTAAVFRPPFSPAPLSGEAFESARGVLMVVIGKYPVALLSCALLAFSTAAFLSPRKKECPRKKCEGDLERPLS